ncbi:hypothetical protein [Pseudomonas sp. N040]|uniref:hypothetical protein n=1 Tax=Pseudomonas sp. N040 TaxID=2785325 RepID=UPI0018A2AB85|nr:hypothetical protein [Pseudomonas sp. N040]MBF7730049.1 hypothetical protein [Pseudomonas sp. N040]MBW7013691.1 hypothetical protein [Pseudomonas sp. N040]
MMISFLLMVETALASIPWTRLPFPAGSPLMQVKGAARSSGFISICGYGWRSNARWVFLACPDVSWMNALRAASEPHEVVKHNIHGYIVLMLIDGCADHANRYA